jgi:hypothetical protein
VRPRNTASARCDWHAADGLVVVEVVAELGHVGVVLVLAVHQLAAQQAFGPQPFAQALHQRGVFGPALGQDVAHAVQHGGHGRQSPAPGCRRPARASGEGGGFSRVQRGVGEQLVGQRLDAGSRAIWPLVRRFCLKGRYRSSSSCLVGAASNRGAQRGRQLALLVNALEHGGAALFQLAQVGQAGLQLAQLDVVQPVGGLLAVAGDEGHRGPAVQQLDGSA